MTVIGAQVLESDDTLKARSKPDVYFNGNGVGTNLFPFSESPLVPGSLSMSAITPTRELLLALAQDIIGTE